MSGEKHSQSCIESVCADIVRLYGSPTVFGGRNRALAELSSIPFVIHLLQRQFISSPISYHVGHRGIRLAQNKQCLVHRNKVRLQTVLEIHCRICDG